MIPVMDGNATSCEVSGLKPYTTYTFCVSAMTEAGAGPPIIVTSTTSGMHTFNYLDYIYLGVLPRDQFSLDQLPRGQFSWELI